MLKNRNEIRRLVELRPLEAAELWYRSTKQLRIADELMVKLNRLHKHSDSEDYRALVQEIRMQLADYIDWYHNEERFDDRH